MKITYLLIIMFAIMVLTSCGPSSTNPHHDTGILRINNNTNANVSVSFLNISDDVIDANSYTDYTITTNKFNPDDKSATFNVSSEGTYSSLGSISATVYTGETTTLDVDADIGVLHVINATNGPITIAWGSTSYDIASGHSDDYSFDLPSTNSQSTTYNIEGQYVLSFNETTTITRDDTFDYTVYADAGCLEVLNSSGVTITQIFVSLSSNSNWGSNDLDNDLNTGYFVQFTLDPDSYDIKIVDSDGFATMIYNIGINTDETDSYTYLGKKNEGIDRKITMDDLNHATIWAQRQK